MVLRRRGSWAVRGWKGIEPVHNRVLDMCGLWGCGVSLESHSWVHALDVDRKTGRDSWRRVVVLELRCVWA